MEGAEGGPTALSIIGTGVFGGVGGGGGGGGGWGGGGGGGVIAKSKLAEGRFRDNRSP